MAYIRDHILHVFFQFHLKYILLFFFQNSKKESIKKTENRSFCVGSKDLLLKLKLSEQFQTHFFQVICKLFLVFSPFWVGHLYRSF